MASRPRTPCRYPRCPKLVPIGTGGYCEGHKRQRPRDTRPSAAARGYDRKWQAYVRDFKRDHPHCAKCGKPTYAVDHKIPAKPSDPLFWDPRNHQPLCRSCHPRKTASQDGGFGNARRG